MQQLNSVRSYKGGGAKRPGAKRLWCESTRSWAKRLGAKRLWGESSIVRTVQGRIDQVVGESSRGRNVEWAKRLATMTVDGVSADSELVHNH